jgi:predicted transcriptional regulator
MKKASLFMTMLDLASRGLTDEEIAILLDMTPTEVQEFFTSIRREMPFSSMYPIVPSLDEWIDHRIRELRRAGITWENISKISDISLDDLHKKYLDNGEINQKRETKRRVTRKAQKKTVRRKSGLTLSNIVLPRISGKILIPKNKEEDSL